MRESVCVRERERERKREIVQRHQGHRFAGQEDGLSLRGPRRACLSPDQNAIRNEREKERKKERKERKERKETEREEREERERYLSLAGVDGVAKSRKSDENFFESLIVLGVKYRNGAHNLQTTILRERRREKR
jgi:hypothetical protein